MGVGGNMTGNSCQSVGKIIARIRDCICRVSLGYARGVWDHDLQWAKARINLLGKGSSRDWITARADLELCQAFIQPSNHPLRCAFSTTQSEKTWIYHGVCCQAAATKAREAVVWYPFWEQTPGPATTRLIKCWFKLPNIMVLTNKSLSNFSPSSLV